MRKLFCTIFSLILFTLSNGYALANCGCAGKKIEDQHNDQQSNSQKIEEEKYLCVAPKEWLANYKPKQESECNAKNNNSCCNGCMNF